MIAGAINMIPDIIAMVVLLPIIFLLAVAVAVAATAAAVAAYSGTAFMSLPACKGF